MLCPECRAPLTRSARGLFDDIPVDECEACGGAFYPAGSLDRLDDSVVVDAEALIYWSRPSAERLECPRCTTDAGYREPPACHLEPLSHPDACELALARCGQCSGFWLARGMLDALRQLVLEIGVGQPAGPAAQTTGRPR